MSVQRAERPLPGACAHTARAHSSALASERYNPRTRTRSPRVWTKPGKKGTRVKEQGLVFVLMVPQKRRMHSRVPLTLRNIDEC